MTTNEPDLLASFSDELKQHHIMPVPLAWDQLFVGELSAEEAAAQRVGVESPQQIATHTKWFRPPSELEVQAIATRAIAAARPDRRHEAKRPWMWGLSAAAGLLLIVSLWNTRPDDPQDPVPRYSGDFPSQASDTRGTKDRPPEIVRYRMDMPLRWTLRPAEDDAGASLLEVYVRSGDRTQKLDVDFERTEVGLFKVRVPKLRSLLGESWPRGISRFVFVIARPTATIPADAATTGDCAETEEVRCFVQDMELE